MGLTRVAVTLVALSLYLAAVVTGLYSLVFLWASYQSPTHSNLLTTVGLVAATAVAVGVGRALSRRGGVFTGYGAGGIGKTQGPR
jgi:hypothetical protein